MTVRVVKCWGGGDRFNFELNIPYRGRIAREYVVAYDWSRKTAIAAKNVVESLYHVPRNNIRFRHV